MNKSIILETLLQKQKQCRLLDVEELNCNDNNIDSLNSNNNDINDDVNDCINDEWIDLFDIDAFQTLKLLELVLNIMY